jgi:uncharacterized membrane protein YphA (DoxX/SURF4 family)
MRSIMRKSGTHTETGTTNSHRKTVIALWTVQGLLAALFLFAGLPKLVLPIEDLTRDVDFPELFIRFIGVCEVLGGLGLVLPGLTRIRTGLTPLAAAGLMVIMIGATTTVLAIGGGAGALFPFVVGLLLGFVAYGRTRLAPHAQRRATRRPALQPAN